MAFGHHTPLSCGSGSGRVVSCRVVSFDLGADPSTAHHPPYSTPPYDLPGAMPVLHVAGAHALRLPVHYDALPRRARQPAHATGDSAQGMPCDMMRILQAKTTAQRGHEAFEDSAIDRDRECKTQNLLHRLFEPAREANLRRECGNTHVFLVLRIGLPHGARDPRGFGCVVTINRTSSSSSTVLL